MNIYEQIMQALRAPLPGWVAQKKMINYMRPDAGEVDFSKVESRPGAVLVLIYPKENALHTVLTLRQKYNGTHSGQVSFPGGKPEPADPDLWHTALREAEEETGLETADILFAGRLTQVYIPPSKFLVSPFVGVLEKTPKFKTDSHEVSRIIETPLSFLFEPERIRETRMQVQAINAYINVRYFDIDGETVWGATAMMLSELREVLEPFRQELKMV